MNMKRLIALLLLACLAGTAPAQNISSGTATGLTGLGIRSTGAAFDLTLASSEVITAGRTLSFVVGDAPRTLTMFGSTTVPVFSQQITFAGPTAARTVTFPDASFTAARTDAANTFTGTQTFSSPVAVTGTTAADQAAAGNVGEYQEAQCLTVTSGASISFTNATPTVGTYSSPPWTAVNTAFGNFACPFQITANAPTGLSTATNYWAVPINSTTFHVATSAANALAGTFAATTGTTSTANLTTNVVLSTTAGLAPVALDLTAGDWDCMGSIFRTPTGSTSYTNMQAGVSTSSTTMNALGTYADWETAANVVTVTNNPVQQTPMVRANVSSLTPYYLVALDTFSASSDAASGDLRCRRMR